jgi:hypothetical protein
LGFADRFIKEEKYIDAMINLNDAITYAKTNEEKREIYIRYLYLLTQSDNFGSAYTVLCKLIYTYCERDSYLFDGIDMVLKDSLLFSNNENMLAFDGLDIKAREDYITIRELYRNEEYNTLFDALPALITPDNPYFPEIMKMAYDATQKENFKVGTDKILKAAMLMYPAAPDNPYLISMLLDTKDKEVISVLEKGYRLQLERAEDNYFALLRIGRAYMLSGRYEVASKFFARIMQHNPHDEETLWTAALCSYLLKQPEKGRRLLNTYAAFFKCSDAPVGIYRSYMDSDEVAPSRYPFLSDKFIAKELARLKEFFAMFAPSDISITTLEDLFKVAGYKYEELYEIVSIYPGEVMHRAIKRMLSSMRINSFHKLFLFNELVKTDYEGSVDIVYKDRIFCGNVLKLRARGINKSYFRFYKEIVAMIPFCEEMIPLKCSVLAEIVKSVAKEYAYDEGPESEGAAKLSIFTQYAKRLRIKIDSEYYRHVFNASASK